MDAGKRRQPNERRQLTTQSSDRPGRIVQGTDPCIEDFPHRSALSSVVYAAHHPDAFSAFPLLKSLKLFL